MIQVETNGDIKNLEGFVKFPDYPLKAKVIIMASNIFIGPESNHCMIALSVTYYQFTDYKPLFSRFDCCDSV